MKGFELMNLQIKFELNKSLDKAMAFEFLNMKAGGMDFSDRIISVHPELKIIVDKDENEQKQLISDYFDKFYETNDKDLKAHLLQMGNDWEKDESKFILQLKSIFKNTPVPEGKYIGYLSIINCNPRFLEDKTFQVFYKHRSGSNFITVHEVLHFFFYDYAERAYPEIFKKLDQNSGAYWDLAELFNDVVMSDLNFISKEYSEHAKPYPDHVKHFDRVKDLWGNNPDLDAWLIEAYNYLASTA